MSATFSDFRRLGIMKPISAFPLIAMLVIVVILIAFFGGYF